MTNNEMNNLTGFTDDEFDVTLADVIDEPTQTLKSRVPDDIDIPEYLERLLTETLHPVVVDKKFCLSLGKSALAAKVAYVEDVNMARKSGKLRMPDKLSFEDVAVIMMSLYAFRSIQTSDNDDRVLGRYDDNPQSLRFGTYVTNNAYLFEVMERLAPSFKNKDMQDAIDKIERACEKVEQTVETHLFPVKNGVYNQITRELEPHHPDNVYMSKTPVDYVDNPTNPVITAADGYNWDVESWIRELANDDEDVATLLWQVIADCLQPQRSRHKSIWFYSEKGNNGKGTLGQLIKNLLGKGNYSSLSVVDFNHEFMKSRLLGVAANIADENDVDVFVDSVKDYKASVTGDDININRKYENPVSIQFTGTNIQMMNGLPKTKDKSGSFYRRLIIVPFIKSFTNNGERKYIKTDYINRKEVLEYVLHKAVNIEFDEYIMPAVSAELLNQYEIRNNPVLDFWEELKGEFAWDLLPNAFVYDLYKAWFERNNPSGKKMGKGTFTDHLTPIITNDPEWSFGKGNVRSKGRMDADEPLITEYGLGVDSRKGAPSPWIRPGYAGDNEMVRRDFARKDQYRGIVRN